MSQESELKELFELIENAKKVMVTTHLNPDMDAVGSSLGLYWILKSMNKDVDIVLEDSQPFEETFLEGLNRIQKASIGEVVTKYDLIIITDVNHIGRLTRGTLEFRPEQKVVIIDHHDSDKDIDTSVHIKKNYSSSSEIIFEIFAGKVDFSIQIAKALLAGIYDDTNGFSISNVSKQTLLTAAQLVEKGAVINEVAEYINSFDETVLNAVKTLINNLQFDKKYKYAFSYITRDLYEFLDLTGPKMDIVMNLTLNILLGNKGYNWGFVVRPSSDNSTKVSLRSRSNGENVRKIAESLGGGGHDQASGATLEDIGDPYEAIAIVRNRIEELLK